MSDIQSYISRKYSGSESDLQFTSSTSGFFDQDSILGKKQTTSVGDRFTTIPSYNANTQFLGTPSIDFTSGLKTGLLDMNIQPKVTFGDKLEHSAQKIGDFFKGEGKGLFGIGDGKPGFLGIGTGRRQARKAQESLANNALYQNQGFNLFGDNASSTSGLTLGLDTPQIDMPDIQSMQFNPELGQYSTIGTTSQIQDMAQIDTSGSQLLNMDMNTGSSFDAGQAAGYGQAASMIGGTIESLADDQDPTKWNAGEIGGSILKGAGKGAAMGSAFGPVGTAVGAVGGALVNLASGIFGRKKARKQAKKQKNKLEKQQRTQDIKSLKSSALSTLVSNQIQGQIGRAQSAAQSMTSMLDKYGVNFERGGLVGDESRPEHLKYTVLSKEHDDYSTEDYFQTPKVKPLKKPVYNTNYAKINKNFKRGGKVKMTEGGNTDVAMHNAEQEASALAANVANVDAGAESSGFFGSLASDVMGSEQYKVAQKQGIKHGIKTGIKYGTTRAAGMGLLNKLGTRIGSKFIPGVGQAWLVGDIGYYGTKWMTKKYAELHDKAFGPALDAIQNLKGIDVRKKIEQYTHAYGVSGVGSGYSAKYNEGGMTKGEFSHKTNPLTVVDKHGNDTGMELTGGEGVFDKEAMKKIEKYKLQNDFKKAGEVVFSEMEDWKDAGTARYGTKIKEYNYA